MSGTESITGIRVIMFDLGGTLWMPFGEKTREEVLSRAAGALVEAFSREGRYLDGGSLLDDLHRSVAGLRPGPEAEMEKLLLNELVSLARSLSTGENPGGIAPSRDGALREIPEVLDPCSFPVLSGLREVNLLEVVYWALRRAEASVQEGDAMTEALKFASRLCEEYLVFADTVPVLEEMRRRGFVVGIVSNTSIPPQVMDTFLVRSGLRDMVDFRVYSSEVGWRKPHPAIYRAALKSAGALAHETLFVGDRFLEDVAGPRCLGMKAVLCRSTNPVPEQAPDHLRPHFLVRDLFEMADLTRRR